MDVVAYSAMAGGTLIFAIAGYELYALFVGMVTFSVLRSFVLLILKPVRIGFTSAFLREKKVFPFAGRLIAVGVTFYLFYNLNQFVLGKTDLISLGLYGLAFTWATTPAEIGQAAINRVLLPTYSALKREGHGVFTMYLKTLRHLLIVAMGVFLLLYVASPFVIHIIYDSRWYDAIPILLVLLVFGLSRTVVEPAGSLLVSYDRVGLLLAGNIAALVVLLVFVYPVALEYGALGCAVLMTFVYGCYMVLLWYFVLHHFKEEALPFASAIYRPVLSAAVAIAVATILSFFLSGLLEFAATSLTVFLLYTGLLYVFCREDLVQTIRYVRDAIGRS